MLRSYEEEILESGDLPPETVARAHRGLSRTHRLLGNHAAIIRALRSDGDEVRRVLDIGCGHGGLLERVKQEMDVEVIGVDLRPPANGAAAIPIVRLDAVRDRLPEADVAVSVCLVHHLRDEEFVEMIRNVGRSCRRFVILDLVRHYLPLALFSIAAPLCLPRVNVLDGRLSIRRAYTPGEFRAIVQRATTGTEASFKHTVAPFWIRQMADIRFRH